MTSDNGAAVRSMMAVPPVRELFRTEYEGLLKKGDTGWYVGRLQQWLCLHGYNVEIDEDFGGATETALMAYQAAHKSIYHLVTPGVLDECTWRTFEEPIRLATTITPDTRSTIPELIVKVARQHLLSRPRELRENTGPWVRYYTRGSEGPMWPWCAGFVSAVVTQAFICAGKLKGKFTYTLGCDQLMQNAIKNGQVISAPEPGCLFAIRKSDKDWIHTGIVIPPQRKDVFYTIEGNSNSTGSREGTEVCSLTRAASDRYNFIKITE